MVPVAVVTHRATYKRVNMGNFELFQPITSRRGNDIMETYYWLKYNASVYLYYSFVEFTVNFLLHEHYCGQFITKTCI